MQIYGARFTEPDDSWFVREFSRMCAEHPSAFVRWVLGYKIEVARKIDDRDDLSFDERERIVGLLTDLTEMRAVDLANVSRAMKVSFLMVAIFGWSFVERLAASIGMPDNVIIVVLKVASTVILWMILVVLYFFLSRSPVYWITFERHVERVRERYRGQEELLVSDLRVLEECGTKLGQSYGQAVIKDH